MTYEAGNERPANTGQGRGRDGSGAHRVPSPSERGAEAEPEALHDPVQADRRARSARDLGVAGAGASDEVGPLHRPPEAPGAGPEQRRGQERQMPPVPPVQAPGGQERGAGGALPTDTAAQYAGPAARHGDPASAAQPGAGAQLLPHGERDKLGLRLQQAVNHFVDEPRRAVEEADHVLEEAARHVADTLAEHRRSLRGAWESKDRETETEELRVALRKYREVTERLLQM